MSKSPRIWFDESKRMDNGRVDAYLSYPELLGARLEDVRMRYELGLVDPLVKELVRLKNAVHTQCEI